MAPATQPQADIDTSRLREQVTELFDQQAATAEILKVIGRSPADMAPVFRTILSHAVRLCRASVGAVFSFDGTVLRNVAHQNASPEFVQFLIGNSSMRRPGRETTTRRCALERRTVHTADLINDPDYNPPDFQRREGVRAAFSVPMISNDKLVGVITLWRHEPMSFTPKQMALVETFADQAVIAIENLRLFKETRDALEQQKASAEVLGAISGSISDAAPVFDKIMESCERLFAGQIVGLNLVGNDGMVRSAAVRGAHHEKFQSRFPVPLDHNSGTRLAIVELRAIHFADVERDAGVPLGVKAGCQTLGIKSVVFAPLLREGRGMGAIFVGRDHICAFTDGEIALLQTFADQAAVAIENVRLFNETREALGQQQALAEVLGAMSASIADTQPVFDRILESCERLFQGHKVGLTFVDDDGLVRLGAYKGDHQESMQQVYPYPLARDSGSGRAILDQKVIHIPDVGGPDTPWHVVRGAQAAGFKSIIFVPLIDEDRAIGALWVARPQPVAFDERAIELLRTFADQAVIAIRNTRLFHEVQEKSRQLEIASQHKSEFLANMSHELRTPLNAIIGFTRIVMRRCREQIETRQYENLEKILSSGQHLLALINSILDLAKVEAGRIEVHPAEVELAPVLESYTRMVEPLVKSDAVTLLKAFDSTISRVYLDEEKLRQIVLNLLSNAAKFTTRGNICLSTRAIDDTVKIAVTDSGIGIAPDKLEVIFDEFAQADSGSTRNYGGTGLGLTIARRLARLMGGDLIAESALGNGSTFTLTLPLRYSSRGE